MTGLRALSIEISARPSPSWVEDAACRYASDPEIFFDQGHEQVTNGRGTISKANAMNREAAKSYCRRCPVIDQCREHYLLEPHGVYGGLDKDERHALISARRAIAQFDVDPDAIGREAFGLMKAGQSLSALAHEFKIRPGQLQRYLDAYLRTSDGLRVQLEYEVSLAYEAGLDEVQTAVKLGLTVGKVQRVRHKLGLGEKRVSAAPVRVSSTRYDSSVTVMGTTLQANYLGESAEDPPFFFMQVKYPHASTRKWMRGEDVLLGTGVRRHIISKGVGSGQKRKRGAGDPEEAA